MAALTCVCTWHCVCAPCCDLTGVPAQIIIVLALACAAFYYAQCRSESLRLAAGTGGPDKAKLRYARAVFATELFGMVTLLFYAVHTTFKPSPFIPRHAEVRSDARACLQPWVSCQK